MRFLRFFSLYAFETMGDRLSWTTIVGWEGKEEENKNIRLFFFKKKLWEANEKMPLVSPHTTKGCGTSWECAAVLLLRVCVINPEEGEKQRRQDIFPHSLLSWKCWSFKKETNWRKLKKKPKEKKNLGRNCCWRGLSFLEYLGRVQSRARPKCLLYLIVLLL